VPASFFGLGISAPLLWAHKERTRAPFLLVGSSSFSLLPNSEEEEVEEETSRGREKQREKEIGVIRRIQI